jgi:hypothetical protein
MTEHIKLTSSDFYSTEDLIPEAVLDDSDPIMDLRKLAGMEGNLGKLAEYKGYGSPTRLEGSNPSITAAEKINYQNNNDVQPGSPEWFRLWFSKPYLTGEKPW